MGNNMYNSKVLQIFFRILYSYIAIILCFVPLGLYFVLTNPDVNALNSDFLLQSISDLLNEGNLFYFNFIVAMLVSLLNMLNITPGFQYRMNTLTDFSALTIVICILGILLMICLTRLKLTIYSFVVLHGENRSWRINIIDVTLTFTFFLLINILAGMIQKANNPLFWALLGCGICVFFLIIQRLAAKNSFAGTDGYFGSLSRLAIEALNELIKAIFLSIMIFFMYYIGNIEEYILPMYLILYLSISCVCGMYLCITIASCDEPMRRKIRNIFIVLGLYIINNYVVTI